MLASQEHWKRCSNKCTAMEWILNPIMTVQFHILLRQHQEKYGLDRCHPLVTIATYQVLTVLQRIQCVQPIQCALPRSKSQQQRSLTMNQKQVDLNRQRRLKRKRCHVLRCSKFTVSYFCWILILMEHLESPSTIFVATGE